MTLKYHLSIVRRSYYLFDKVEKASNQDLNLQSFLISAKARYIKYLTLLENIMKTMDSDRRDFIPNMALPPWYLVPFST